MCLFFLTCTHEHTLGEQDLQPWLCLWDWVLVELLALRTQLRSAQGCRILPLKDSPASLLVLGTTTRLSFVGRDGAGAGSSTTGVCNENCRAEDCGPFWGEVQSSPCAGSGYVLQPKCWRVCSSWERRGNASWLWTCPS